MNWSLGKLQKIINSLSIMAIEERSFYIPCLCVSYKNSNRFVSKIVHQIRWLRMHCGGAVQYLIQYFTLGYGFDSVSTEVQI